MSPEIRLLDPEAVAAHEPEDLAEGRRSYLPGHSIPTAIRILQSTTPPFFRVEFKYSSDEKSDSSSTLDDNRPVAVVVYSPHTQRVLSVQVEGAFSLENLRGLVSRMAAAATAMTGKVPLARCLSYRMSASIIEMMYLGEEKTKPKAIAPKPTKPPKFKH